jgi:hypothetical protein
MADDPSLLRLADTRALIKLQSPTLAAREVE